MRGACSLTLVLLACTHAPRGGTGAEEPVQGRACNPPTRSELLKEGSIGAKWNSASRVLAYGRPGADGRYDTYLADAAGQR